MHLGLLLALVQQPAAPALLREGREINSGLWILRLEPKREMTQQTTGEVELRRGYLLGSPIADRNPASAAS